MLLRERFQILTLSINDGYSELALGMTVFPSCRLSHPKESSRHLITK